MSSEEALWNLTRTNLAPFGKMQRIENRFDLGIPDVCWTFQLGYGDGQAGWLELKYVNAWPTNEATPLSIPHFTTEQARWAKAWEKTGRSLMLLQVGRDYLMIPGVALEILFFDRPATRQTLKSAACSLGHNKFPRNDILLALTSSANGYKALQRRAFMVANAEG